MDASGVGSSIRKDGPPGRDYSAVLRRKENFQAFGSSWASQPNMPDRIRSETISARSLKTASSCASKVTIIVIFAMCFIPTVRVAALRVRFPSTTPATPPL
jgi:hypothetical protein